MTTQARTSSRPGNRLSTLLPILGWLPLYRRTWLRADLLAGLAVWAMTVPQALAYAGIAGVPPVYALYAIPLAMAAYAVFGTSRTLCVGPESAIAIISAVTVGGVVTDNATEFAAVTALLALVVGLLFLLFGFLRLGWAANFLAQPVLQGLTQGIALTVIMGQFSSVFGTEQAVAEVVENLRNVPAVLGLSIDHTGFILQTWAVLTTIPKMQVVTTIIGLGCLVLLFAFRRFLPHAPSALIAVVLAVLAVAGFDLADQQVRVIGEVPTGMVSLSLPALSIQTMIGLLPGAFAIVLLGYSVSLSVAKLGAQKTGEEIDPNQELVGLGVANLGAAFSSGFVVCGSLSRGSIIMRAGGRTQVVSLINAGLVVLTLLFALPLFYKLPYAALSAIVITAMYGLLDFGYFRRLLRIGGGEFACAMAALLGVLLMGILQGVALGVILALGVLIKRVSHPGTAILGRLPGTDKYRDVVAHDEAERVEGLLIFRFDAPIIFVNAGYFAERIRQHIADASAPVHEVLIPAQQINQLDSTGADQLIKLHAELSGKGIGLSFAEVKHTLRKDMRQTGLEKQVGEGRFYETIEEGVEAIARSRLLTPEES